MLCLLQVPEPWGALRGAGLRKQVGARAEGAVLGPQGGEAEGADWVLMTSLSPTCLGLFFCARLAVT